MILYGLACSLFALNMYLKDETSYKFKKGWEQYKEQSYMLLPKVFSNGVGNLILYAVVFGAVGWFLSQEHPETFSDFSYLKNPATMS